MIFERKCEVEKITTLASDVYKKILLSSSGEKQDERQPGTLAALHKSVNVLNYHPQVHLTGTRELVNTATGEIHEVHYIPFKDARFIWIKRIFQARKTAGVEIKSAVNMKIYTE